MLLRGSSVVLFSNQNNNTLLQGIMNAEIMTENQRNIVVKRHPQLALRFVAFAYHNRLIKKLLVRSTGLLEWRFPMEYVSSDESIHAGLHRMVFEITGITDFYFSQMGFSEQAFNREEVVNDLSDVGDFVCIDYYILLRRAPGLTNHSVIDSRWYTIDEQLQLNFVEDKQLLKRAQATLKRGLNHEPIGYYLLDRRFTLPDMHSLYEQLLDKKLNRGNFSRKMLGLAILNKLGVVRSGGAHKSPDLYEYDKNRYFAALETGLVKAF